MMQNNNNFAESKTVTVKSQADFPQQIGEAILIKRSSLTNVRLARQITFERQAVSA
jgi:hypothetical protein